MYLVIRWTSGWLVIRGCWPGLIFPGMIKVEYLSRGTLRRIVPVFFPTISDKWLSYAQQTIKVSSVPSCLCGSRFLCFLQHPPLRHRPRVGIPRAKAGNTLPTCCIYVTKWVWPVPTPPTNWPLRFEEIQAPPRAGQCVVKLCVLGGPGRELTRASGIKWW